MTQGRKPAGYAANPWWLAERAAFATDPTASRGRLHAEPESASRTPFQRDRDRIIHSAAFRRLKQKTQVFIAHEGDYYRTRLTHTLEVAQIARSVARTLGLDEDLAETVALAHDLGHPPFGHSGEDELNACMERFGGFDHNAQTLRVVTRLENRYPAWDGLNLCWETLEGVVKHNGPLVTAQIGEDQLPRAIRDYAAGHDLELATYAGPEAQIAALADDIAYNNHDIDDGLRAKLFTLDDLVELPFVGDVVRQVRNDYPNIAAERWAAESVRRLIGLRVADLVAESKKRAALLKPKTAAEVRAAGEPLVGFSDEMRQHERALRRFLFDRMYRHYRIARVRSQARRILKDLFELFLAEPDLLPDRWREQASAVEGAERAVVVCDYIAGMTDPYAINEHRRLFNLDLWS
jgi:dGTPase